MPVKTRPLEISELLDSEETRRAYLDAVMADGDPDEIVRALGHIARAQGMTEIARAAGLGRENLYNATRPGAKPRFDTIWRILVALNLRPRLS